MKTIADIQAIRESMQPAMFIRDNSDEHLETRIVVGMGTCGISKGAKFVFDALVEDLSKRRLPKVRVYRSDCQGLCDYEPTVEVYVPGKPKVVYGKMTPEKALEVMEKHVAGGKPVEKYLVEKV